MADGVRRQDGGDASDQDRAKREEISRLKGTVDGWLMWLLAAGVAASVFYGLGAGPGPAVGAIDRPQLFGPFVGMLLALSVAGAAMGMGAFAGFLFGLPRALTNPEVRQLGNFGVAAEAPPAPVDPSAPAQKGVAAAEPPRMMVGKFAINTNLERISDWLTTMIVGLGLANLYSIIPAIEEFGERFRPVFGTGGNIFAIGCGLYFLIFGFLVSYISTRTKLTLIFTENEYDATSLASGQLQRKVDAASAASSSDRLSTSVSAAVDTSLSAAAAQPIMPGAQQIQGTAAAATDGAPRTRLVQASATDQTVLDTIGTVQRASSLQELLALANARARSGDADGAVGVYQEIVRSNAFDVKIWLDYASALGLANREAVFLDLLVEIRSKGAPSAEAEARNNFSVGLLGAVQAHLYDGQFDKSIAAGETLERYPLDASRTTWLHVWLACAWGQSFAANKGNAEVAEAARVAARVEVRNAIAGDPSSRQLLRTLYDPAPGATDRDLEPLKPDPVLDELLADPEPATRPPRAAAPRKAATRARKK